MSNGGGSTARLLLRSSALVAAVCALSEEARADAFGLPIETRADSVSLDGTRREIELAGNVEVDASPFHLRSERLLIKRTAYGVDADGNGRLTFCPCLGTPLGIRFSGVTVAPPGDLFLRSPVLEVYSVPVMWLPFFWLRSPARVGILPPDIAYRGTDGMFFGGGVHVPWIKGDDTFGLNVRAGGYTAGGSAYGIDLRTPESSTRLRFDHRVDSDPARTGDGFAVDVHGALGNGASSAVWDGDLLRGARAVKATSDVAVAALPYDRLSLEGAVREGGFVLAAGMRTVAVRGGLLDQLDAYGPLMTIRRSDAIGAHITYEATLQGGALRLPTDSFSYARGDASIRAHQFVGPVALSASGRGVFDAVSRDTGGGGDGVATARIRAGVPLGRAYGEAADPWLHRIEPNVSGAVLYSDSSAPLFTLPTRLYGAAEGAAWSAQTGVDSDLGRWARRDGMSIGVSAGAVGDGNDAAAAVRGRVAGEGDVAALRVDGGALSGNLSTNRGGAFMSRARIGEKESIHLGGWLGVRRGVDPIRARLLTDAPLEPTGGFYAAEGTTGGASILMPWAHFLSTGAAVDADLDAGELVAARLDVTLRDRCRCTLVKGTVSRRIGRDGVDAWLSIELTPR